MARTDLSYPTIPSSEQGANQFERLGHPGRYTSVIKHVSGITDLTGSNYGYGSAMMIGSGSSGTFGAADAIELSGGGEILLRDFPSLAASDTSTLLEISVAKITTTADAPHVYFFKRQQ